MTTCRGSLGTTRAPGDFIFYRFPDFEGCSILRQNADGLFYKFIREHSSTLLLVVLRDIYVLLYFIAANLSLLIILL